MIEMGVFRWNIIEVNGDVFMIQGLEGRRVALGTMGAPWGEDSPLVIGAFYT